MRSDWWTHASLVGSALLGLTAPTAAPVSTLSPQPTASVTLLDAASSPALAFTTEQAPGGAATAGKKVIALTFDDGPGPYTPQVLSVLRRYHVPATFFEIGANAARYPQYTQQLTAAGYPVEDHTWTHPDLSKLPAAQFPYQIDQTQHELRSLTGITPACVRPPYNNWSPAALDQIAQRGLTTMSYSIDPRDWSRPGTQAIVDRVVSGAFPGGVVDLHDGGGLRDETVAALPQIITDLAGRGFTFVSICGPATPPEASAMYAFGGAPQPGDSIVSSRPFVASAADPTAGGYWLAAADGGIFSLKVPFLGSMGGQPLNQPAVAMVATGDGKGYWLATSDGGVFTFGDAGFHGSTGSLPLAQPIVAMASDPATGGYWLVASGGGIFSFDAPFLGSLAGLPLNRPIVGMAATADGNGYELVASDGGVFTFGDARFQGSTASLNLNQPVVAMASDPATGGYWLEAADGGIFSFDAPFFGSRGGQPGSDHFFAITPSSGDQGYLLAAQHPTSQP